MPIAYAQVRTPQGREVLGMTGSGDVTGADAEAFQRMTLPSAQYFGWALFIVVERSTSVSTEARRVFTNLVPVEGPRMPAAIVTPNPTLRVLLNFMTRVSGGEGNTRFFTAEREALEWLDQQLALLAPAAAPSTPGGNHG